MPPPIPPDSRLWGLALSFKDLFVRALASLTTLFFALSAIPVPDLLNIKHLGEPDPCAVISGQKWVAPSDVRACFTSFEVNQVEKANILSACSKILNFHTSTNYQIRAPEPFADEVNHDIINDLARINETHYTNDLFFHIDVSRSFKKLRDSHAYYVNRCYDDLYNNIIPLPLVHLTDKLGSQRVHIAPEAFIVAKAEFPDQIEFWQESLPKNLTGGLESLSGAEVLSINGKPPYQVVDENAFVSGGYQGLGTRQNSFFSSYSLGANGWNYVLGQFASESLPFSDNVTLIVLREGKTEPDTFTIPFRSRISPSAGVTWTDRTTFRANNCKATADTNGRNCYASPTPDCGEGGAARAPLNVSLPPGLVPASPLSDSYSVAKFYYLNDTKTGVLALGSFRVADSINPFRAHILAGLRSLKRAGAEQLIIDVTNNGGGHICTARWLHRVFAGVKNTTEPQSVLYTEVRSQPLAQAITAAIVKTKVDDESLLLYNPVSQAFANNTQFREDYDWLKDPIRKTFNGHEDFFSQKLGKSKECQLPSIKFPPEVFFDPKKVAIIGNGRCVSSCSLFSVTMSKLEGAKTVVFGGRKGVKQQYCGTVGGESSTFARIKSDIKTTNLAGDPQAPPDFLSNSVVGINWRLALGIWNKEEPEEWQDHPADFHLDLTKENVNNPLAIWNDTYTAVFKLSN